MINSKYSRASVAQIDACPTCGQVVAGSTLAGQQLSFVEIDYDMISMVILSILLIQEGRKNMHNTVNRFED